MRQHIYDYNRNNDITEENNTPIRIAIVDDHPGVRAGIKNLLKPIDDVVVIGEGEDGSQALKLAEEKKPDILLLDVELPVMRGEEVARRLRKIHPEIKVLALSSYNERLYIQGMMKNGAAGYITKDEAPSMLVDAIHSIHNENKPWISPRAEQESNSYLLDQKTFTNRELEILKSIQSGNTNPEIAGQLGISEENLSRYLKLFMIKFNVDSRAELIKAAERMFGNPGPS